MHSGTIPNLFSEYSQTSFQRGTHLSDLSNKTEDLLSVLICDLPGENRLLTTQYWQVNVIHVECFRTRIRSIERASGEAYTYTKGKPTSVNTDQDCKFVIHDRSIQIAQSTSNHRLFQIIICGHHPLMH